MSLGVDGCQKPILLQLPEDSVGTTLDDLLLGAIETTKKNICLIGLLPKAE